MSPQLLQALRHLVRREGDLLVASPYEVRELGQLLQVLAAHRAALGVEVTLSRARLDGVSKPEPQSATVVAQAGVRLGALEQQLAAEGLTLGHLSPGAMALDVAGFLEGPYAGLRSVEGGRLEPVPMAVEAMLSDGRLLRTHASPRSATGPDLMAVVLGGGGQLALLTAATLRCLPRHREHRVAAWSFASTAQALGCLGDALDDGALPASVRLARSGGATHLTATFHGEAGQVERDLDTLGRRAHASGGRGAAAEGAESWAAAPATAGSAPASAAVGAEVAPSGEARSPAPTGGAASSASAASAGSQASAARVREAGSLVFSQTLRQANRLLGRSRALLSQLGSAPTPRPAVPIAPPRAAAPLGEERELRWDAIGAAVDAGRALTLYRLSHASCVVVGALDGGLLLSSPVPPSPLQATFDPHAVLSGAPSP